MINSVTAIGSVVASFGGEAGAVGPPGPPGPGGSAFDWTQAIASDTWVVNHNLGYVPIVAVMSPGGLVVYAEVTHVSVNQTVIVFNTPQTGTARFV